MTSLATQAPLVPNVGNKYPAMQTWATDRAARVMALRQLQQQLTASQWLPPAEIE